jgi:predicted pyridoxine 5'-phosphate oxidase superfamily flavin-nucleotide-binding protein
MDATEVGSGNWHAGERAAQAKAGAAERMEAIGGRVLRRFMPDQHRAFFAQLPFLVIGSLDPGGQPFASLLFGPPGFASSPDPTMLLVRALPGDRDPLAKALGEGVSLGILGIELPTLRRNRMNGRVAKLGPAGFIVAVDQSFGNCAQYIHRRDYVALAPNAFTGPLGVDSFSGLDPAAAAVISRADTAFIASAASGADDRDHGVDVSHRGGMPGFLKLDREGRIVLPDYRGNFFFNTLGNLLVNPRVGLTLVDFESGDLLQLTGKVEIVWDGPELAEHPGAKRLTRIESLRGQWVHGGFPLRTELREASPQALAAAGQKAA